MDGAKKDRHFGLGAKLNIMLIACILLTSLCLVIITYHVYCRKVNTLYFERAERAATAYPDVFFPYGYLARLREAVDSDEFRAVRAQAIAANDENIIREWMKKQPPTDYQMDYFDGSDPYMDEDRDATYTLYGNYNTMRLDLKNISEIFEVDDIYLQYYKDGLTYTLVDPDEDLFSIGKPEEPIDVFSSYVGDVYIPPTVYQYGDRWLCTTCVPVYDALDVDGDVAAWGMSCVDIDMNAVMAEFRWFIINSAVFIAIITLAALGASIFLTRRLATKPLKLLAQGATGFAKGENGFSTDDVIQLPIRSTDEIGALYHEIQSMQRRIVDNTEKLTHITAERERVSTELRMASQIQTAVLPSRFPAFPERGEFDLYASMDPAKEVGGDFYDFFLVDDDHLAMVIADVSDKGIPAALFMMSAKNIINYRAQMGGTPGEILTSANAQLCKDNEYKMFVTAWLGILELSTGRLVATNAGHEYPILKRPDGAFEAFRDKHGIFMGVMPKAVYKDYELTLEPGSRLFVYTDGLTEAINEREEQFGMERILRVLNDNSDATPRELLCYVKSAVGNYVGDARQFDDLTMLCLAYKGPQEMPRA